MQNFHFKELNHAGHSASVVNRTIAGNNICDAAMTHFNSIQRGEYHPNNTNFINPNSHGRGIRSPLDQFEIRDLLSLNAPLLANLHVSYTNIGLYLTIAALMALALNFLASNYNKIIANK